MGTEYKYEPGELERTRKNIGPITNEEAKEIAGKLGGKISNERPSDEINEKYEQFQKRNRRRSDILPPEKISFNILEDIENKPEIFAKKIKTGKEKKPSHINRIKINFLAARPEHLLKTRANAFLSIFSFITPIRDTVHPSFFIRGDKIFYNQIEKLVISTRNLISKNKKNKLSPMKNQFFLRILDTIKNWDIAGINRDLSALQKSPRNILFSSTSSLTRKIYRPIIILNKLNPSQHIIPALKEICEKIVKTLPKNSAEADKIRAYFSTASELVYSVFVDLKKALFPLLLKQVSNKYYEYNAFIREEFIGICSFLGISANDMIQPEEEHFEIQDGSHKQEYIEPAPPPIDIGVQIGFTLLNEMFPQAGWDRLKKAPDMFAYYKQVLILPKDTELLAPGDALQYVIILVLIIQELIHGFRSIKFGELQINESSRIDINVFIEEINNDWHLFIDKTMEKNYLPILRDYCRQMERSPSFKHSDYGIKIQSTLLWTKRKLVLPYYDFNHKLYSKPAISEKDLKLFEQAAYAVNLLSGILSDMNKENPKSVGNPRDKIIFEIESPVSRRLFYVMKKNKKRLENKNLILYATSIIMVLDYLLNSHSSPFYNNEAAAMFRHDSDNIDIPEYAISEIDVNEIWKNQANEDYKLSNKFDKDADILRGYLPSYELRDYLIKLINDYPATGKSFCVLIARLPDDHDAAEIIDDSIREMQDITFYSSPILYYVLLPDTNKEESKQIINRIKEKSEIKKQAPASIAQINYQSGWDYEFLREIISKSEDFLISAKSSGAYYYNETKEKIEKINDIEN